jgi:uncharacterized SAM-binding protein YcdF (DUF218 family)
MAGSGGASVAPHPGTDAVIIIFGAAVLASGRPSATLRRRVEAAAGFAKRFAAPLFVPTGGVGRFAPSEAAVMAKLLAARGIPTGRILLEETGTDTLSSARAVARMLRVRNIVAPVFVSSSLYHLARCVVVLRVLGVPAHVAGPPFVPAGSHWITRCYWWLREAVALPYDVALAVVSRLRERE